MAHLQYLPGDPRLVDQLVYELKSKGIFDQFRKECIADVDTRPAYQNLRQRVETSVATFLSRQIWKPDLNKNQLREKLRKHLLDGNYLEQGVERIVDQVVNPKVASVFIPQVEDLVYNYLGIPRKKPAGPETSNGKPEDLLPTDLEAVSPGSVKSNGDNDMDTSESKDENTGVDDKPKLNIKDDSMTLESFEKEKEDTRLSGISELTIHDSDSVSIDKNTITIPLPAEIKLENIPAPENSPPNIKDKKIDLEKIDLPKEPNLSTDIPLPDEIPKIESETCFKPIALNSEDDDSSNSSLRRNMSPLTPIRNFNNENSCDAQQAFENDSDSKSDDKKEPSTFRFTIESKSPENSPDAVKTETKEEPEINTQPDVSAFNTTMYEDSSNSNNLQIDYESDVNSKMVDIKPEIDHNSQDSHKKDKKDDKKVHKSSHKSRDSHKHSSSKDKRSESKHSNSSSRHDKKPSSKDDKSKSDKKSDKENPSEKSDRGDKKDSKESSKHKSSSSHKDSKSSSHKDSKHRSSSSSKHSSKDDKKSSSSREKDKEKSSSSKDKDKSKDSKSRDKDRKSSSSSKRSDDKENKEKKEKKEADDHYSLSGRGNPNRRSTDRDSNDGGSSKGSHNPSHSRSSNNKKETKSSSKSGSTSSSDTTSPSDGVEVITAKNVQTRPVVRVDTRLEQPVSTPPRLPFVPDVTLKKPKFAANYEEAKQLMKMRKFMEEEQKRMNQEAALLLEFQANVRPSLSQVYSSIPGPELEFACMPNAAHANVIMVKEPAQIVENEIKAVVVETNAIETNDEELTIVVEEKHDDEIDKTLIAMHEDDDNNSVIEDNAADDTEAKTEHTDFSVFEELVDRETISNIEENNDRIQMDEDKNEDKETEQKSDKTTKTESVETIKIETEDIKAEELIHLEDLISTPMPFDEHSIFQHTEDPPALIENSNFQNSKETPLYFFAEHEKFNSELEKDKFNKFLKKYMECLTTKLFLINCNTYEQNLIKEAAENYGQVEIVNYFKNGHSKLPNSSKNIIKNVNVATEIVLPTKVDSEAPSTPKVSRYSSPLFSPVKSECSFELSSDYDAKLEEMVNKTSRQEIMEIILGGAISESPSKMPIIDYFMESNIEEITLKRKYPEVESTENNNTQVLTPNKLRKMSVSDQISSTTEESEESSNNNRVQNATRSKFLGKARRVGLPKPKKSYKQNSPSSDKSVENYEQNSTPNGKMKATPRTKVQRYDTSDLYKPKLHYLSRRNNIT